MAIAAKQPRRQTRTPGRSSRASAQPSIEPSTEPPNKRRKFLPGGPGGGGRYFNHDGDEISKEAAIAAGLIPGAQTMPRSRPRREHTLKVVAEVAETPSGGRPVRARRERPERYVPPMPTTPRPRYSSAAAAAAASQMSDGYKPREERSWEDFHPDLEIDAGLMLFTADEVDGRTSRFDPKLVQMGLVRQDAKHEQEDAVMTGKAEDSIEPSDSASLLLTPAKRKPGRPPRRAESMLSGLGSPPAPRILPLPIHNPKERLNLPKASFRRYNHFLQYEESQKENKDNYVDRTMANHGYQESDEFVLPPTHLIRLPATQQNEMDDLEVGLRLESDGPQETTQSVPPPVGRVEYDMDEQDLAWIEEINEQRKAEGVDAIKPAIFEITMTQIEKEYYALEKRIPKPQPRHAQTHRPRSSSQAAVNGDLPPPSNLLGGGDEPDSKCSICDDGDCENTNAIIFCDGCDLAVHQECYGVPFIPEGQWFCRKCKNIGMGTPTCLFCPNVDGAFKQTNTLRWSHLLCAIWIPEVNIANMTFMEPISDVDKVPKSRWKLSCYICQQRMGACIQCGNKNCYQAFHVTCARRARLFLRMKGSQGQGGIDTTALRAFCDKHVPPDWRRSQGTDHAIVEAKRWYRHNMKNRRWADSQTTAIELGAAPQPDGGPVAGAGADDAAVGDTIAVQKRRRTTSGAGHSNGTGAASTTQAQTSGWRLANSGAPVVPAVVYAMVEASLVRFALRRRKEFVERACRYWTLKREARRGAALLKRLQLQLEIFSTMEITRREFAAMGAIGGPRLERRIGFAEVLTKDLDFLTRLCGHVKQREELRLKEVELLRELVDTVYFPVTPLLRPVLERALKLDDKSRIFTAGLEGVDLRLRDRYYTSVVDFSRDLARVFNQVLSSATSNSNDDVDDDDEADVEPETDIDALYHKLHEVSSRTAEHHALSHEQKELKKLAKRIVKAVKELLDVARSKEAQLRGREMEEEIRRLEALPIFAAQTSASAAAALLVPSPVSAAAKALSASLSSRSSDGAVQQEDVHMADADAVDDDDDQDDPNSLEQHAKNPVQTVSPPEQTGDSILLRTTNNRKKPTGASHPPNEPLSPPISRASCAPTLAGNLVLPPNATAGVIPHSSPTSAPRTTTHDVFAHGGIPWYLAPFDPVGTTIHEERYMGRAVLRDMSEELSDMDEDTLTELAPPPSSAPESFPGEDGDEVVVGGGGGGGDSSAPNLAADGPAGRADNGRPQKKRVARRNQWSRRR